MRDSAAGPDDAGPDDAGPDDAGLDDAGPDDAGRSDDAGVAWSSVRGAKAPEVVDTDVGGDAPWDMPVGCAPFRWAARIISCAMAVANAEYRASSLFCSALRRTI
jgi:hypothetical protein